MYTILKSLYKHKLMPETNLVKMFATTSFGRRCSKKTYLNKLSLDIHTFYSMQIIVVQCNLQCPLFKTFSDNFSVPVLYEKFLAVQPNACIHMCLYTYRHKNQPYHTVVTEIKPKTLLSH